MKKLLKEVYNSLPFKKYLFLLIKQFGVPSRNIYQHLHFVDNINVKVNSEQSFKIRHYGFQVENDIFWKGIFNGWEKVSLTIWAELCKESNVIFDIGANTGVYSLLAKTINKKATVYAFEPVDRVYDKLVHNNRLNTYNINCIKKAVSDFDGQATIYDKESEHTYSVTVNKDISLNKATSIPKIIETIKLETFIESENLTKIDLLKIDVETHEVEALTGFGKYISEFQPTFIIEILSNEIAEAIEKIISGLGYVFFVIDEESGVKKVNHLKKSDYFNFLICKPKIADTLESVKHFSKTYIDPDKQ